MRVEIHEQPFDPFAEVKAFQDDMEQQGRYGATAIFIGTMRDFNEGDEVREMWLEHYPGMTEKYLQDISAQAQDRWPLLDSLIIHRVGRVYPNDPIVVVAVWSAHRGAAYEANRYLMEELKSRAPFWKKESLSEGERWVEHNTPG